jgi:hypothetical protein
MLLSVGEHVGNSKKLVDYIKKGDWIKYETFERYDIEIFHEHKCVATRIQRLENKFNIKIIVQEDLNKSNKGDDDWSFSDWSDTDWFDCIEGNLEDIDKIITDDFYNKLIHDMEILV